MIEYDYIILGAGASGLMLAYRMAKDPFFDSKKIIIIEKDENKKNDRTWCFWEENNGEWDEILTKSWHKIYFGSQWFSNTISIKPLIYKMIKSEDFYNLTIDEINKKENITFCNAAVLDIKALDRNVEIQTSKDKFRGVKVFNSIADPSVYNTQTKYPVLQQHFVGWFIETDQEIFDDTVATFMDFNVPQKNNTRFMYILPTSKTEALFEYTLFSKDLLTKSEYENSIKDYLLELGVNNFTVKDIEFGSIPMTSFNFNTLNSSKIINIGTAGGWTKASTGYTFYNTSKQTKRLIQGLKEGNELELLKQNKKYRFFDIIFLDVLAKNNYFGSRLFSSLFKKAKTTTILKFLNEETSIFQDIRIIISVPPIKFLKALCKRIIN